MLFTGKMVFGQTAGLSLTGKDIFKPAAAIVPGNFKTSPAPIATPTFNYRDKLAFFCRQEVKFEKATKVLFKFRLGSVQYVDYLEGKIGSGNYQP